MHGENLKLKQLQLVYEMLSCTSAVTVYYDVVIVYGRYVWLDQMNLDI
jgi:hypothetical protein